MTIAAVPNAIGGPPRPPGGCLAILDSDSGFLQVLTKRLGAAGWQHRVLASPVPLETLVVMHLNGGDPAPATLWSGLGWDESSWTAKSWGDAGIPDLDWTAKSWGSAQWNGAE